MYAYTISSRKNGSIFNFERVLVRKLDYFIYILISLIKYFEKYLLELFIYLLKILENSIQDPI